MVIVRLAAGDAFPGWPIFLGPLLGALLWPVATWLLLRPQRRQAHEQAVKAYEALTRPARDSLARLEEPYHRELHAKKLARIADTPQSRLPELLPWEWKKLDGRAAAA